MIPIEKVVIPKEEVAIQVVELAHEKKAAKSVKSATPESLIMPKVLKQATLAIAKVAKQNYSQHQKRSGNQRH